MASLSRLQTIARSLKRNPLPYSSAKLYHPCEATQLASSSRTIAPPQCLPSVPGYWQLQSRRTLILEPATSASESVKLNRLSDSDSGIVEVCLDRPGAKNAIGKDIAVPTVFCAGADLKERKTMSPSEVQFFVNSLRLTFSSLEDLHIPTIAVIEGVALGGGLELALSCDLRICGDDAVLGLPETGLAIIPGAGGTQRLPRLVGKSLAKELVFTGRRVGGKDAKSMGLVNHSVASGEAHLKALEIARDINQKGPLALKMAKRAITKGLELDMVSALELEEDCYEQLLNTKDRLEGLAAFAREAETQV
ncbi:hypothetical protein NL676_011455 [Syzygium grande]|nr:hypothetical protein NL676_011455 [Syzygium grande]